MTSARARRKALRLLVAGALMLAVELVLWFNLRAALFLVVSAHWWLWIEAAERYGWARGHDAANPDIRAMDRDQG